MRVDGFGHISRPNPHWMQARSFNANPLMLLSYSVDTPVHDSRFHLLALCCASRCASCVDEVQLNCIAWGSGVGKGAGGFTGFEESELH